MDKICYDNSNQIDNNNIPDEFVEITSWMRLRNRKMKGNLAKIIHTEFENNNEFLEEIIEDAIMSGNNYYLSFFTEILGEICDVSEGKRRFIGAILEMLNIHFEIQDCLTNFNNNSDNKIINFVNKYGNSKSIIASNTLLSFVFQILSNSELIKVSRRNRCELIGIITKYIGKDGIDEGQMLKLVCKNKQLYDDEQTRINKLKISSLYLASVDIIKKFAENLTEKQKSSIKNYVNNLCNVFDIYEKIKKETNAIKTEGLLKRLEIVRKQAIKQALNIGKNNGKLVDFINYNCYIIDLVAKKQIKTDIIEENKISNNQQTNNYL